MLVRRVLSVVAAVAVVVSSAAPAYAAKRPKGGGGGSSSPAGYDISWPQCGGAFPTNVTFGVVGVDNGIVFSANPCLGTGDGPSELAWAEGAANHAPAFYANTANPGPAYSSHWPAGQTSPRGCDGSNSADCSYDYGWNAAQASFEHAVTAERQVHPAYDDATAHAAAAGAPWWLDVETGNSWETLESAYGQTATAKQNDIASLQGAADALAAAGVAQVGFYSTSYQWNQITGGTGATFAGHPSWVAGFSGLSSAQNGCTATGFTGGRVALTQYKQGGFDVDYAC